ncbi:MAG: hypothetical protein JWO36_6332 [Myxococcales bacterium]|nr:hypothetical protein [Myxococcales bacterium]
MKLASVALVALALVGCSKSSEDKAKDMGKQVEAEAKDLGHKVVVEAKKDEKLAEKKIEIGAVVDFAEGMKVLCEAVSAEVTTYHQLSDATSDALHKHPNPEVIKLWGSLADVTPADRVPKVQAMADRAALKTCPLIDWLKQEHAK